MYLTYFNENKDLENVIVLEGAVHAFILSNVYSDLTYIYQQQNFLTADMTGLINLGSMMFAPLPAYAAVTEVIISIDEPATSNILIPEGSTFESNYDNTIVFGTLNDTSIAAGQQSTRVGVQCLTAGPIGNVSAEELSVFGIGNYEADHVLNPLRATGGVNAETPVAYLARLQNWKYILQKGTYDAYLNALSGVPSATCSIVPFWNGTGTVEIIVDPPLQTVIDLVANAISNVKAVDDDVTVVPVQTVAIDISCIANISLNKAQLPTTVTEDQIRAQIKQCITTYINGGKDLYGNYVPDLGAGVNWIPFKCSVFISEQIPVMDNIDFIYPISPIVINKNQKATAGTITVEVI